MTQEIQIPFGDLKRHYQAIKGDIDLHVLRTLESGWYILGQELAHFEEEFAQSIQAPFAVGVGSGTEALHLALVACGIHPGDEVITVPNTAVPTLSAISFAQGVPVFVDIDPISFCMDVRQLEQKITLQTRAIIPVHLFGQMCNMTEIMRIAQKHRIAVIEDCAQAHGARFEDTIAGNFGDFGCFSFYPSKNLGAFGDAGLVVTQNAENAERIRLLRNYGQTERYYHETVGFNSRLDEIQAAILRAKLPYLLRWNERRREIARLYAEAITNPHIMLPQELAGNHHVYHLYVIRCRHRDALRHFLAERGIGTQIHYPIPCHLQRAYQSLGYAPGSFPIAEQYAKEILSLPNYPELNDQEIYAVADVLNQFEA